MAQVKKPPVKNNPVVVSANPMKNLLDSFSYAAGLNIANNMKDQGITDINTALMMNAIEDVMKDKSKLLSPEQASMTLQQQLFHLLT